MNDLLERYLAAVCSYFYGKQRGHIYQLLKEEILSKVSSIDELEALLVDYGHPRSIALTYGYRPLTNHIYNHKYVLRFQKIALGTSLFYLISSSLYYLYELNCIPFTEVEIVSSTIQSSSLLSWILTNPFTIMILISFISFLSIFIIDKRFPVSQEHDLSWDKDKLYNLPHPTHYSNHLKETIFMLIFLVFFIIYIYFFNDSIIMKIQHNSSQMIHLMKNFFYPFIIIFFLDYCIDITKRTYKKPYIRYSLSINLFSIIALSTFVVNSQFLKDYLLPPINPTYITIDLLVWGCILLIYIISIYRSLKNIKAYYILFNE